MYKKSLSAMFKFKTNNNTFMNLNPSNALYLPSLLPLESQQYNTNWWQKRSGFDCRVKERCLLAEQQHLNTLSNGSTKKCTRGRRLL